MGCGTQVQPEMPGASGLVTADPQPQREASWPVTLPRGWAVTGLSLGSLSPRLGSAAPSWRSLCGAWWPCLSRTERPQGTPSLPRVSHRRELRPQRGLSLSPSHPRSQIFWVQGRVGGQPSRAGATLLLTPLHQVSALPWLLTPETGGVRDRARAGRGFEHPAGRTLVDHEALWFSGDSGAAGHSLGAESGPMGSDVRAGVFPLPPSFPEPSRSRISCLA